VLVFGAAWVPHVNVLLGILTSEVHIVCRPAQVHGASHARVGFRDVRTA
jgi:hypothetical protein